MVIRTRNRLALMAFLAALGLVAACGEAAEEADDAAADVAAATVQLDGSVFAPETVEIDVGDTVQFVNEDPVTHDVAFVDGESSPDLAEGDVYERTFDEEGVYAFECTYHPSTMQGTVVVGGAEVDDPDAADEGVEEEADDDAYDDTYDDGY